MKIEEMINEEMCALFAPDGSCQTTTIASDMAMCMAFIKVLHKAGIGKSYNELSLKGYKILPIRITIVQDGNEEDAFQKMKKQL